MPKIAIEKSRITKGSGYPAPFHEKSPTRTKHALGDAGGLTQFGVNLTKLPPGEWSSQRHWHTHEDEFVYVLEGEVVLVSDKGEEVFRAGDCIGFPKNTPNGHHFINRGRAAALYLEVGSRIVADDTHYPDIDLFYDHKQGYTHRDGTPYPKRSS
jgi:uncharacterized cupin superfamily protein